MTRAGSGGIAVSVRRASISFEKDEGGRLQAVDDLSIEVRQGEFVAIIGPSGCGKSTLLNAISGLAIPEKGRIEVLGQPVTKPGNPRAAYMFQEHALLPWKTARQNVALPLMAQGRGRHEHAMVDHYLDMVGLQDFHDAYPGQLSGGMRQRVQLARTLVTQPELILMDEPFGSLDAITRGRIQQDFLRICEAQSMTVMLVTHDVHEAVLLADRVVVLSTRPGRIILELEVPFPRPRLASALEGLPGYHEVVARVTGALQPPLAGQDGP